MQALEVEGLHADIDPRGHKAMQPQQSHGRWQVNGICFEVHPGYSSSRKRKQPDILIVQGRKGWKRAILDRAALAIRRSLEGIQQFRPCAAVSQASAGSSRDWPSALAAATVAGNETHGVALSAACPVVARSPHLGRRLQPSHCTDDDVDDEGGDPVSLESQLLQKPPSFSRESVCIAMSAPAEDAPLLRPTAKARQQPPLREHALEGRDLVCSQRKPPIFESVTWKMEEAPSESESDSSAGSCVVIKWVCYRCGTTACLRVRP